MFRKAVALVCCTVGTAALLGGGYYLVIDTFHNAPRAAISITAGLFLIAIFLALWRRD